MTFSLIQFIPQRFSPLRGASANFSTRERGGASSGKNSVPRNIFRKNFSAGLNSRDVKQTKSRKIGIFARFQYYLRTLTPAYKVRMTQAHGRLNDLKISLGRTKSVLDSALDITCLHRGEMLDLAYADFITDLNSLASIPARMRVGIESEFKQIQQKFPKDPNDTKHIYHSATKMRLEQILNTQ